MLRPHLRSSLYKPLEFQERIYRCWGSIFARGEALIVLEGPLDAGMRDDARIRGVANTIDFAEMGRPPRRTAPVPCSHEREDSWTR